MAKSHDEDRISDLPRNVIDCIMDFMPVRDAARTCVLSSKWRYIWADHPSLILDKCFWVDIHRNKLHIDYADIVSSILLYHVGDIRNFAIDVSLAVSLSDFKKIDLWLSYLCRKRLKKLEFWNSKSINLYKLPFHVLSTSELTYLAVSYCLIKSKDSTSGCFTNIQCLVLEDVTLESMVLKAPLLTSLTLERCRGVGDFDISAPKLEILTLEDNDYLNLKPFLTCKCINYALLYSYEDIYYYESINLLELLAAWPRISALEMNGFCFKYLATGNTPDHTLQLNLRVFELVEMALDAEVVAWILCILKNSRMLHTFEIWFLTNNLGEEVNDVDEPSINMDYMMIEQLCTIKMKDFTALKVEVMFAKILLRCCAPVEVKMLVEEDTELDPNQRLNILKNLLVLQRASPKSQIFFGPNLILPL